MLRETHARTLSLVQTRRAVMLGNLTFESQSSRRIGYPEPHLDLPESFPGSHLISVAALLQSDATVAESPRYPEASRNGSEWERISLAVHRLRTNCLRYRLVKRALDILLVSALLPFLLPLFLIVALMVKIGSSGPVLYGQRRIGRFGREFKLWKFRSMCVNGEEVLRQHLKTNPAAAREWAESRKLRDDPRVTKIGRLIRRTSLDELPQFINILAGHMSLVGPRPIVAAERAQYRDAYFFYASAKPGLSGLWQVSGRSDLSYDQRVALDEHYVRRWNIALDVKILLRTAAAVWGSRGAV
jgi:exopolysaccharide production protein ExoY